MVPLLDIDHTALLVVDMQEKLLPHIHEHDRVTQQCVRMIGGAVALRIPVLVTEQYRKGLGPTVAQVASALPEDGVIHEKLRFSACVEPIGAELATRSIRCVLVCGIETHVCILQTCLDLIGSGHLPFIVEDAVGSRREGDRAVALRRLAGAGVTPTTVESALLELVGEAGGDRFKTVLPLIR